MPRLHFAAALAAYAALAALAALACAPQPSSTRAFILSERDLLPESLAHDPRTGSLRVDGHDIRALDLAELRDAIALVPQQATIFAASARAGVRVVESQQQ